VVAALGGALFARPGIGGAYWVTFLPAVGVLGLGMAITVAPLTTTAMTAIEAQHAGVASGVNNAVARIAGLVAIAVFGILLVRAFDADATAGLDRMQLSPQKRAVVDQELPKLAGADMESPSMTAVVAPAERVRVRRVIDESFIAAFRVVMAAAAVVAMAAGVAGFLIR